jgi:hypothetical protein
MGYNHLTADNKIILQGRPYDVKKNDQGEPILLSGSKNGTGSDAPVYELKNAVIKIHQPGGKIIETTKVGGPDGQAYVPDLPHALQDGIANQKNEELPPEFRGPRVDVAAQVKNNNDPRFDVGAPVHIVETPGPAPAPAPPPGPAPGHVPEKKKPDEKKPDEKKPDEKKPPEKGPPEKTPTPTAPTPAPTAPTPAPTAPTPAPTRTKKVLLESSSSNSSTGFSAPKLPGVGKVEVHNVPPEVPKPVIPDTPAPSGTPTIPEKVVPTKPKPTGTPLPQLG